MKTRPKLRTYEIFALAAAGLLALAVASPAAAAARPDRPLTDTVHIRGNLDTGGSGYWAALDYDRTVQITPGRRGTWTVALTDAGTFRTLVGKKSPEKGVALTTAQDGTFQGTFAFQVKSWDKPTARGVRDYYNYRCNANGTGDRAKDCRGMPAATSTWPVLYFGKKAQVTAGDWRWTYNTRCGQTWDSSNKGNTGDITNGCPRPIVPTTPTVTPATCTKSGSITAPAVTGLTYSYKIWRGKTSTKLVAGQATALAPGQYVIKATADDGYKIKRRAIDTWNASWAKPRNCPVVTPTPTPSPTPSASSTSNPA